MKATWIKLLLLALFAGFVGTAAAKAPPLLDIPPRVARNHPGLVTERAHLVTKRAALRDWITRHNAACPPMRSNEPKAGPCKAELAKIETASADHIRRSNAFNAEVRRLAALDTSEPDRFVVNPGALITNAEYRSAERRLRHLRVLEAKLEGKIAEVRGWRQGLRQDTRDYEAMRADAERDLAWEFIDHLPVSEGLDELEARGALKGVDIHKIEMAYEAAKGIAETGRGLAARDGGDKAMEIETGNRALRNAMIDLGSLSEKDRALLKAVSTVIDAGAKAEISASTSGVSAQTAVTLAEVFEPWAGVAVLGEHLTVRRVQYVEAQKALDSLHEAESRNWNAERYLKAKLARVRSDAANTQLTITKYEMAHHG